LARSEPDDFYVSVRIRWRQPQSTPPMLKRPAGIPELPDAEHFEVFQLNGGSYTLVTKGSGTKSVRFGKGPTFFELERAGEDIGWGKSWAYVEDLIKQFQPDFDFTASEDNARFLLRTLKHLNELENRRYALWNHLQHSSPGKKKAKIPRVNPDRDVKAAILSDVMDLSSLDIAETLGFERVWKDPPKPWTLSDEKKRENATARTAAERGRELLRHFYGAEEWQQKVARMRALRAEWLALENQPRAQVYYLLAEARGTSIEAEERKALQDGFDELVRAWIAAWERGDRQTADEIKAADPRFDIALRQF
jgi:hypothetical protein